MSRKGCWTTDKAVIVAVLFIAAGLIGIDSAIANPFGVTSHSAAIAQNPTGLSGWLLLKQAEFYRMMTRALRSAQSDGSAYYGLVALSFAYGIFHAAGPGHGKAVITSYLLATEQTWRRGMTLSWLSALLQAMVAIAIVITCTLLLGLSAKDTNGAVRLVKLAGYLAISALGLQLAWRKARVFLAALVAATAVQPAVRAATGQTTLMLNSINFAGSRDPCSCGQAHCVDPAQIAAVHSWRQACAAIVGVGLRPCSGALIVLVFAAAQDMLWTGILSTLAMAMGTAITVTMIATIAVKAKLLAFRLASAGGSGPFILCGMELLASLAVLAFGLLLLAGYMTSETTLVR